MGFTPPFEGIMKKVEYIEIDYHEFEQLVKKTYGVKDYSFVATQECGNDSQHSFNIEAVEVLDEYDAKYITELIAGKHPLYINYVIFQDLVNKGVLQPGNYLVEVCW